jgi:hypothetical protein
MARILLALDKNYFTEFFKRETKLTYRKTLFARFFTKFEFETIFVKKNTYPGLRVQNLPTALMPRFAQYVQLRYLHEKMHVFALGFS